MLSALSLRSNLQAFRELVFLLTRHRQLTVEMARREISDRYAGQFFGLFWAIGHPLVLMLVYVFIFGFVFKVKITSSSALPLDYTTYILSGLIPWLAFTDVMAKSSIAIVGNANLVKQVVFPIEVLPVKGVISTLITEVIFLLLLVIYVVLGLRVTTWTYLLLPILVFLQALAMIGVGYILAAVGVYLRDTKDFVQVFNMIGLYLVPALYLPEFVPGAFQKLLYLNPFSYLIWCYQDALYFGGIRHPWAWIVFAVLSVSIFVIGYRAFRKFKLIFGNFI
jgi:lipopolysaccharide transport system permease protein